MAGYEQLVSRTDADALIPEPVSNEIIQGLTRESAALSNFRRVRMSSKTVKQPVLSALPEAYWVSGDTGLKQTTDLAWGDQTLTAEELAVIVAIPAAVVDDAAFDMWAEARPKLIEAFGRKIDQAALFGVDAPTSWGDGITELAVLAGNVVTEGDGVDFADDVALTIEAVENDGHDVNSIWARRKIRGRMRRLRDQNQQPLLVPFGGDVPDQIYSTDVSYVRNGAWVNNYELIAGDRNMAILGVRQDITFQTFDTGVISDDNGVVVLNLMQQDAIALRAVMRVAFAVAQPISAESGGSAFPFAVLINAGS